METKKQYLTVQRYSDGSAVYAEMWGSEANALDDARRSGSHLETPGKVYEIGEDLIPREIPVPKTRKEVIAKVLEDRTSSALSIPARDYLVNAIERALAEAGL